MTEKSVKLTIITIRLFNKKTRTAWEKMDSGSTCCCLVESVREVDYQEELIQDRALYPHDIKSLIMLFSQHMGILLSLLSCHLSSILRQANLIDRGNSSPSQFLFGFSCELIDGAKPTKQLIETALTAQTSRPYTDKCPSARRTT